MKPNFQDSLSKLERLSPTKLDKTSRRIRGEMADAEWKMSLCLLALKRSGAFRKLGFGTLTAYAERVLRLSGRKVGSLLGAAEALEHLPLMSEAFREGRVGWSKVRVMHGLATPETEGEWLKFAEAHTSTEVERQVAVSPRKWKRHRALKASIGGKPAVSSGEVKEFLDRVETGSGIASGSLALLKECKPTIGPGGPRERDSERNLSRGDGLVEEQQVCDRETKKTPPVSDKLPGRPPERPLPPSPPRTIRVVFELTPDQYALYEQAESRVRAQEGRRVPRAEVLHRMAESVLAQGTAKSRARHQVLVHTTEGSDEAWYETERGVLPVASEVLEEALGGQEILHMDGDKVVHTPCESIEDHPRTETQSEERPRNHSCDSGTKRTAIPNGVIRRVFARAGHRCECCGRKGGRLDVHHRTPVSEGGRNELDCLELLCRACHTKNHEVDFEEKAGWRAARGKALSLPKQAFGERNRIGLNCDEPGISLFQFGSD